MKPELITFTGADDLTAVAELERFAARHPNVEFGLLISRYNRGPRYPSFRRIKQITEATIPRLSLHIEGAFLADLLVGGTLLLDSCDYAVRRAQRIQLNFHGRDYKIEHRSFIARIRQSYPHKFIFQCDGVNGERYLRETSAGRQCSPLFDLSGGAGVVPAYWPLNKGYPLAGYAGGLGADNIAEQLPKIANAANERPYWIDMETKVCCPRTGLRFEEMEKVCQAVHAW